jgi:acyl-CoA thioesterase
MGYLEEIERCGRDANPFLRLMDISIHSYGDGMAQLSMPIRPDMLNGQGWLQGGILTALSDEAMALALYTMLQEGELIATISENTSYLMGIREGRVMAQGWVIKKGRQVAFSEARIRREDINGPVLSQTSASFALVHK